VTLLLTIKAPALLKIGFVVDGAFDASITNSTSFVNDFLISIFS
jgi:hypothetical protein